METTTTRRNVSAVTDLRIGLIIKAERERKRLKQDELAMAIGCKQYTTISNYEKGRRTVPADRVEVLAQVLGLDPRIIDPEAA